MLTDPSESATGFDGLQLIVIADENNLGPPALRHLHQLVHLPRADHAGFV